MLTACKAPTEQIKTELTACYIQCFVRVALIFSLSLHWVHKTPHTVQQKTFNSKYQQATNCFWTTVTFSVTKLLPIWPASKTCLYKLARSKHPACILSPSKDLQWKVYRDRRPIHFHNQNHTGTRKFLLSPLSLSRGRCARCHRAALLLREFKGAFNEGCSVISLGSWREY